MPASSEHFKCYMLYCSVYKAARCTSATRPFFIFYTLRGPFDAGTGQHAHPCAYRRPQRCAASPGIRSVTSSNGGAPRQHYRRQQLSTASALSAATVFPQPRPSSNPHTHSKTWLQNTVTGRTVGANADHSSPARAIAVPLSLSGTPGNHWPLHGLHDKS